MSIALKISKLWVYFNLFWTLTEQRSIWYLEFCWWANGPVDSTQYSTTLGKCLIQYIIEIDQFLGKKSLYFLRKMLPFSDNMTFYERFYNTMLSAYDWIIRRYYYIPSEEKLAKKYFSHLSPLPSLEELIHNVSVVLTNSHRATALPRPSMPGSQNILIKTHIFFHLNSLEIRFIKYGKISLSPSHFHLLYSTKFSKEW